jgi:hypothetical protein
MPRKLGRASTEDLDQLHGLTVKALSRDLKTALKSKEPVPTALLRAAQELLKISDTREGVRAKTTNDPLRAEMPDYSDDCALPSAKAGGASF